MVETRAELPFIGDQVVCLSHDQAARSGPASMKPLSLSAMAMGRDVGFGRFVIIWLCGINAPAQCAAASAARGL